MAGKSLCFRFQASRNTRYAQRLNYLSFSFYFLMFPMAFAWGQSDTDLPQRDLVELGPNLFLKGLEVLLWLSVIVALIFVTVWLLKKASHKNGHFSDQKPIQLIFQEAIGPGKSVCLVRVLHQTYAIGVTNNHISYLSTLEDEEINMLDQWLENELLLEQRLKGGFQALFQRFGRKTGK